MSTKIGCAVYSFPVDESVELQNQTIRCIQTEFGYVVLEHKIEFPLRGMVVSVYDCTVEDLLLFQGVVQGLFEVFVVLLDYLLPHRARHIV